MAERIVGLLERFEVLVKMVGSKNRIMFVSEEFIVHEKDK